MSQERDIQLKLSIYELVMVCGRMIERNFISTEIAKEIIQEARKFAREDD
jgi:hypothetical protein